MSTVFGFGWVVIGAAAVILVGVLVGCPRVAPAWTLLPVAALAIPALAVAADGLRLTTQTGSATVRPATARELERHVYRSGLNTMLVDLRHTALPATGTVPLPIAAGVRRTIVALPSQQCVRVIVHYDVNSFAVSLGSLLTGHHRVVFSDAVIFGRIYTVPKDTVIPASYRPGPFLDIHFSSQGGSLYVRDYPDSVDPAVEPNWHGFQVHPEPRPNVRGTPKKAAARLLRNWRARLAQEQADARAVNALLPGPCVPPAPPTPAARRSVPHHARHAAHKHGRKR